MTPEQQQAVQPYLAASVAGFIDGLRARGYDAPTIKAAATNYQSQLRQRVVNEQQVHEALGLTTAG